MRTPPSGEQWTIDRGDLQATVVEVGGGLRAFTAGGVDVVAGYRLEEQCAQGRGQVLAPWPNRIRDGRYEFGGVRHQLALTEPARGNASHGLVRWSPWRLVELRGASVTVGFRLHPQPGWPGLLDLEVTYELTDRGLTVAARATNLGEGAAPFGFGAHPYVAVGDTPAADVVLTVPASSYVEVDDERKLPTGTARVEAGGVDFRAGRALAGASLDTAFTGLDRGDDGRWRVAVGGLVGRPDVAVWGDGSFDWVQVFTDHAADAGVVGVRGIAVEPLTCPPDAFNSGEGLGVLAPGDTWAGSWGIDVER